MLFSRALALSSSISTSSTAATATATAAAAVVVVPARQLYRELLKQIKQLPKSSQLYYRNYTRQYFANWNTEADTEVLQQLQAKARTDAAWVLQKYAKAS